MKKPHILIKALILMLFSLVLSNFAVAQTTTSASAAEAAAQALVEEDEDRAYAILGNYQGSIFAPDVYLPSTKTEGLQGIILNEITLYIDNNTILKDIDGNVVDISYFKDQMIVTFKVEDEVRVVFMQHVKEDGTPSDTSKIEEDDTSEEETQKKKQEPLRLEDGVWKN